MKKFIIVLFCLYICANSLAYNYSEAGIEQNFEIIFNYYIKEYNQHHYANDEVRKLIFKRNLYLINEYQKNDPSADYGITNLIFLSPEEFESTYLTERFIEQKNSTSKHNNIRKYKNDLPTSFDWREKNVVTAIKNQGSCGSCWAFSATQAIESHYAIKTGKLIKLSEQQIVDCDDKGFGCSGGFHTEVFDYVKNAGGLESDDDYPYVAKHNKTCKFNETIAQAKVNGYVNVTQDETEIARALIEHGPIAVGLDGRHWQFYKRGISNPWLCTSANNHAVLIVGYGVDKKGKEYWIIKNSWGEKWGENGYVRLIKGENKCGVQRSPSYPLIE